MGQWVVTCLSGLYLVHISFSSETFHEAYCGWILTLCHLVNCKKFQLLLPTKKFLGVSTLMFYGRRQLLAIFGATFTS